jgi:hypothetical protein
MSALERYLLDCESKRRRARDRPSNEVLIDLRRLLARVEGSVTQAADATPGSGDPVGSAFTEGPPL